VIRFADNPGGGMSMVAYYAHSASGHWVEGGPMLAAYMLGRASQKLHAISANSSGSVRLRELRDLSAFLQSCLAYIERQH